MMKERILEIISKNSGKITFKNLLSEFNIGRNELNKLLLELKLDGQILQVGNKYKLFPDNLHLGSITISSSGRKYIFHDGEKISVASNFLNSVILNDTVAFNINENNEAEIVSIVDRVLGKMTCEIKLIDGKKMVIPFHDGIDIKLDKNVLDKLYDGDIIVVNITNDDMFGNEYEYIKTIGRRDDPLIDDVANALNFGFDNDYDEEYMKEVYKFPTSVSDNETIGREDYRDQQSVTIDGINTKDMDDGVYAEMREDGIIRVYVHIADVSHYVKKNSRIFERACEKTTSLYLNNSVFHMLHHIISNGICSLNPDADRLTKTVVMDIDKDGNIIDYNIVKSVINSKKKMAYEDVDQIIMNNNMVPGYEKFEKQLYILYDAAVRLEKRYVEDNGKINFANTELSIKYNDDGTIKTVANRENSISRKIIENLMIAANESVANWFVNMDMPTVYRVHEFPNIYKINNVIEELNKEGYKIKPIKDIDNPKSLQKILAILSSYPEYPIISQMLVMAMQRARYSTENVGHYALGLPAYLHFTSPIRRLADLLVHMMIDLILVDSDKITPEYLNEIERTLEDLCIHASKMERQADMAERIAERREILKMLAKNMDQEYEAIIVELGRKIKIRLAGVDTYIDSHDLKDIYRYDSKRKRYYDPEEKQHIKVGIGTKIYVKINNIDPINDKFNVKIVNTNNYCKKKIRKKKKK